MLEKYKNEQPYAYKILKNSIEKDKLSHAYLFETNDYSKSYDFILSFIKEVFCKYKIDDKEDAKKNICRRIDDNNFLEFKIIRPDGQWIKKEQIENLQKEFETKSIESTKKIYLILDADKMNSYAANSLLKFLEEPEENIIAILVTENQHQVIKTIKSRCQIIRLLANQNDNLTSNERLVTLLTNGKENYDTFINDAQKMELIDYAVNFCVRIEKEKYLMICDNANNLKKTLSTKEDYDVFLSVLLLFYEDLINYKIGRRNILFDSKIDTIKELAGKLLLKDLCNKLNIVNSLKYELNVNANLNLLFDKLIIDMVKGEIM